MSSGPICIGDPDGVPESGVRPRDWRIVWAGTNDSVEWPDPAALLGPVREPVDWNPRDEATLQDAVIPLQPRSERPETRAEWFLAWMSNVGGPRTCQEGALMGRAWAILGYDMYGNPPNGWPERDAAGDEEC